MFELHRIEVVHWDYWQRFTLPVDSSIITIVGPNGSGKTTLLDGLRTLLAIDCSAGRDYKRYVRRNQKTWAWLRGVASNPRAADGRYPFFPLMDEHVTLACRIQRKGGDWLREYAIEPGDVPIEVLVQSKNWLGVTDYRTRLEGAGLTRAIKRVLSLEQGDTDKLCEYSPRQLLELVFSVFGDQEVLDAYQQAKAEQQEIGREIQSLEIQLAELGTRLRAADADVNSYLEWRRLKDELNALQAEWLPRLELAELRETIQGGHNQLIGRHRELSVKQNEQAILEERLQALKESIDEAREDEQTVSSARLEAEQVFQAVRDKVRDAEHLLAQRDRLERLAEAQAQEIDAVAAARDVETLRDRLAFARNARTEAETQLQEITAQLAAWRSGGSVDPRFVADFRGALVQAGVRHRLLTEVVEVVDIAWQGAVEAVLAPFRHVVLLENSGDRRHAWELGERLRYRYFVVPERRSVSVITPGSLCEVIRFTAEPPAWLPAYLNEIQRVANANEGSELPGHQAWITPDGYYHELRGARYAGVEPTQYGFGEAARRRLIQEAESERERLKAEAANLEQKAAHLSVRIAEIQSVLSGIAAGHELAARAPEFAHVQRELPRLQAEFQVVEEALSCTKKAESAATKTRHGFEIEEAGLKGTVARLVSEVANLRQEFDAQRREHVARIQAFRVKRQSMPVNWRTREALVQARAKYESATAAQREAVRLQQRLTEGTWVTDELVIPKRDKLRVDHQRLESTIVGRRAHHERAILVTERARGAYINVLRATVRHYGKNLRSLGSLAGIAVDVEPPHLENDDVVLAQAGLAVKFDFDQKGFIGLNDGEASGGQQVMKSLILLIGLLMDETRPGGFVFIDEPFAHLDIFNIDKVGAFLDATRAQYILTTPNTHNVNVFKPSDLTLVTHKRRPGESWAPPVAFLRRDRRASVTGAR